MPRCQLDWIASDDELKLRIRPLREHWEARGPGMISYCLRVMPWIEVPENIEIRLVRPLYGGGGRVIDRSTIAFEAVLANRHSQLPETARLAWLILCAGAKASPLEQAALVPVTLAAAEYVELTRFDEVTIQLALDEWLSGRPTTDGNAWFHWWHDVGWEACGDVDRWKLALPR